MAHLCHGGGSHIISPSTIHDVVSWVFEETCDVARLPIWSFCISDDVRCASP